MEWIDGFPVSFPHKKAKAFLCEHCISVVLFLCARLRLAREKKVRANIYQTWVLNNPHFSRSMFHSNLFDTSFLGTFAQTFQKFV